MNKLIEILTKTGLNKSASKKMLKIIFDGIKTILKEREELSIPGFGVFRIKERPARQGRNPRTGAKILIPAKKRIVFRAKKALKEIL